MPTKALININILLPFNVGITFRIRHDNFLVTYTLAIHTPLGIRVDDYLVSLGNHLEGTTGLDETWKAVGVKPLKVRLIDGPFPLVLVAILEDIRKVGLKLKFVIPPPAILSHGLNLLFGIAR